MKPRVLETLFAALLLAGPAKAGPGGATGGTVFSGQMKDMVVLPMQALVVARRQGRTVIVSDNGRFVVRGELYDNWTRQPVRTLGDARDAAGRIDLSAMRLKISDLGPLTWGTGPRATVFMDSACAECRSLREQIGALADEFSFDIVLLPGTSGQSREDARGFRCAADAREAARRFIAGTAPDPAQKKGCSPERALRALVALRLLGARTLPFVIAPDGRIHQGPMQDLAAWLGAGG